ncbi:MAG: diphosphomevalonate decarboxylase, partial [Pseudomonadota bacterium]|nr:diphosphomevalonate decarboxylase [Pseudomonadota bacterium]
MQASALAHPNIALVKYWGKRNAAKNLPAVGSLSVTLDTLHTRMTVEFRADGEDSL